MDATLEIARSIADAARTISHRRTLADTLQTIVEVARTSLPGFDQVGISTLLQDGSVATSACAGDLVMLLDTLQHDLGEGPSVDTLRGEESVSAPRLEHDTRWPLYVPQAVALGVRSQVAVRLYLDDQGTMGGLNLYSTISETIADDDQAIAGLFAAHSAIALGHAHERESLNEALQTRKVIGQAIGIVMERYRMDGDRAFAFLVRASSHGNIKLRTVAQQIVDELEAG